MKNDDIKSLLVIICVLLTFIAYILFKKFFPEDFQTFSTFLNNTGFLLLVISIGFIFIVLVIAFLIFASTKEGLKIILGLLLLILLVSFYYFNNTFAAFVYYIINGFNSILIFIIESLFFSFFILIPLFSPLLLIKKVRDKIDAFGKSIINFNFDSFYNKLKKMIKNQY